MLLNFLMTILELNLRLYNKAIYRKGIPGILTRVPQVFDHSNLKILSPKQLLQKLPTALVHVKTRNTFVKFLNEIWQIIYSLYQAKEIAISQSYR